MLWCAGFMIYGPQCLVAVIAVNMVPKQAGAAAGGLTGLFTLVVSALIGMFLFLLLWNNNPHLKDKLS